MKHIKPINEFTRTIGFRYSEPTIGYRAILFCVGKLSINTNLKQKCFGKSLEKSCYQEMLVNSR